MLFPKVWRELLQFGMITKHTRGWEIDERNLKSMNLTHFHPNISIWCWNIRSGNTGGISPTQFHTCQKTGCVIRYFFVHRNRKLDMLVVETLSKPGVPKLFSSMYPFSISIDEQVPLNMGAGGIFSRKGPIVDFLGMGQKYFYRGSQKWQNYIYTTRN